MGAAVLKTNAFLGACGEDKARDTRLPVTPRSFPRVINPLPKKVNCELAPFMAFTGFELHGDGTGLRQAMPHRTLHSRGLHGCLRGG